MPKVSLRSKRMAGKRAWKLPTNKLPSVNGFPLILNAHYEWVGNRENLSCLQSMAHQLGNGVIYLTFNESTATDAKTRFPSLCFVRTIHGLAFKLMRVRHWPNEPTLHA